MFASALLLPLSPLLLEGKFKTERIWNNFFTAVLIRKKYPFWTFSGRIVHLWQRFHMKKGKNNTEYKMKILPWYIFTWQKGARDSWCRMIVSNELAFLKDEYFITMKILTTLMVTVDRVIFALLDFVNLCPVLKLPKVIATEINLSRYKSPSLKFARWRLLQKGQK